MTSLHVDVPARDTFERNTHRADWDSASARIWCTGSLEGSGAFNKAFVSPGRRRPLATKHHPKRKLTYKWSNK